MKTNDKRNERTYVKRGRGRAFNDIDIAKQILDDSLLCHVAHIQKRQNTPSDGSIDDLYPKATPTCHWRDGDRIYWHGHAKAANVVGNGKWDVCINVAQLDGLVLARSAFHHSVNYRSVTIFGKPTLVQDESAKRIQMEKFLEKVSPGRWPKLRPIKTSEINMTSIAWLPLSEYSLKLRAEGVNDDEADLNWPVWAGVIPIQKQFCKEQCENNSVLESAGGDTTNLPNLPEVFSHQ